MSVELIKPSQEYWRVLTQVQELNKKRAELSKLGRPSGREIDLRKIDDQKNQLLIQTLELRKRGERAIRITLTGKPEELHPYSAKTLTVHYLDTSGNSLYLTNTSLKNLRPFYKEDLLELIGQPEYWVAESIPRYIMRTIQEINDVGNAMESVSKTDFKNYTNLQELKVKLAQTILELRTKKGGVEGKLNVAYQVAQQGVRQFDLILVTYQFSGIKTGFHLLPPSSYLFPNRLEELINRGGGYDRETRREKRKRSGKR